MREQVFAISLAIFFTLINSCSDNKREKRLDRTLNKTIENVQRTYGTINRNHKLLEISINNIEKIQKSNHFTHWPICDSLGCNHSWIIERHDKLSQKVNLLMESLSTPYGKLNSLDRGEVLKLQVQTAELLRESNKLIKLFESYHKLDNVQLIVASEVDNGIM